MFAVNQVKENFAVVCLEEFSRCTELLAKHQSNQSRRPHHTRTRPADRYSPQLAGTGPLICVYTKLMGQIRGELYSNSCRLGCNTVVNPAKLISCVPERQTICISVSMWEQFSHLIGQINESAVTTFWTFFFFTFCLSLYIFFRLCSLAGSF